MFIKIYSENFWVKNVQEKTSLNSKSDSNVIICNFFRQLLGQIRLCLLHNRYFHHLNKVSLNFYYSKLIILYIIYNHYIMKRKSFKLLFGYHKIGKLYC